MMTKLIRSLGFLCILFISLTTLNNKAFSQSDSINSQTEPIKKHPKNTALINEIEDNIYTLSYSTSPLDMESAMDFILDHPEESYSIVQKSLFHTDISELGLENLWNIFAYLQKMNKNNISCENLANLLKTQSLKPDFISKVIVTSYTTCPKQTNGIIATWLYDKDVIYYTKAFELIIKLKLKDYVDTVADIATITTDKVKLEGALTTLSYFTIKDPSLIKSLLPNYNNYYEVIRFKTALVFAQYPSYYPTLKKMIIKAKSPFEKSAIIRTLTRYTDPDVIPFLISLIKSNPAITTELTQALGGKNLSLADYQNLAKVYAKLSSNSIKIGIIDIVSQSSKILKDDQTILFVRNFLQKIITNKKEFNSIKIYTVNKIKENALLNPLLKDVSTDFLYKDDLTL